MSTFWAIRSGDTLKPDGVESAVAFSKLPFGKPVKVEAKQPRNGRFHRLYWVMCQRIADAIGAEAENVSDTLKIATGHCRIVNTKKFGVIRLPDSISFAAMDETAFREFFERCVQTIYNEWGIEKKDLIDVLNDVLMPGLAA